jgi:hypothetical protein
MIYRPVVEGSIPFQLRKAPAAAVDIGFSKAEGHSTGFATDSPDYGCKRTKTRIDDGIWHENFSFAEAIEQTASVFRRWQPEHLAVLIVEAPLSENFDREGNPKHRGTFEVSTPWYHRAGALTALAGCYFLKKLAEALDGSERTIHLVEGFVTGRASGNHRLVARNLLSTWRVGGRLIEPASQLLSLPALPGCTADVGAPWVLKLNEDEHTP